MLLIALLCNLAPIEVQEFRLNIERISRAKVSGSLYRVAGITA